jgi:hypothetical protein
MSKRLRMISHKSRAPALPPATEPVVVAQIACCDHWGLYVLDTTGRLWQALAGPPGSWQEIALPRIPAPPAVPVGEAP